MNKQELNTLYIACRDAFKEYYSELRNTDDDKQFLVDALKCEIFSNAISLCIELYCELSDSPSLETNCRSILEAIVLFRMVCAEELDEEQIANFKHQAALLFYGNIFETAEHEKDRVFTDDQIEEMREQMKWIVADYEKAMEAYRKKYRDELDERASRAAIRESLFFTNNSTKKKKRNTFTKLFEKHKNDIDPSGNLYQKISTFTHPWYVDNIDDYDLLREERIKDVDFCLKLVKEFLGDRYVDASNQTDGLDEECVGEYMNRSILIERVCQQLFDKCQDEWATLSYKALCFLFFRDILTEMNILLGLGYPEIALSKFQMVCEFWAMNSVIENVETPEALCGLEMAFDYSTRIQLHRQGSALEIKDAEILKRAYDLAFNNSDLTFEQYKESVEKAGDNSSLYFLGSYWGERKPCMIGLVQLMTETVCFSTSIPKKSDFVMDYLFSIDVHHATGFCYTQNRDCWTLLAHSALKFTYMLLYSFAMMMAIESDEKACAMAMVNEDLKELIETEKQEIRDIELKYPD